MTSRFDGPQFHVPTTPYTPIDSLNQRAAALGSPRYGQLTADADYNGHRVDVTFNDYRGYYIAEYFWAGRRVLARGTFADCLRAALAEQKRGALGGTVRVYPRPNDEAALVLCAATPELVAGAEPENLPWYTWRHTVAAQCARDYAHPNAHPTIFDWELMQAAESEAAYYDALRAKHGRTFQ